MARIRTIKPEFWTDETIVRLPFQARLLFIGMWNFADDTGALEYSPDRIGLQVLPAEHDCDISGLIDLLVASGLVDYWVDENGTQAVTISNWSKHQKIDNPSRKTIIKDGYRKKNIPSEARVGVAKKYGCQPGGQADATCYYCGMPGKVTWWKGSNGKPTRWITLSDLEFDHFVSEHSGGSSGAENIVLACRCCNRGKREFDPHQFFAIKNATDSYAEDGFLDSPSEDSPLEGNGSRIKDQGVDQGSIAPAVADAPTAKNPRVVKKAVQLPENFLLSVAGIAYAFERKIKVATEFESFKNWHTAKGSTMKCWDAAWRTWCDKAVEFGRAGVVGNAQPSRQIISGRQAAISNYAAQAAEARGEHEQSIRDITGEAVRVA